LEEAGRETLEQVDCDLELLLREDRPLLVEVRDRRYELGFSGAADLQAE
jgi:hypothetical protein